MKTLCQDLTILTLAALFMCGAPASAQDILCGDVNDDGIVDITDVLQVVDYLVADATIIEGLFEFDDRVGVTIGDVYVATNIWENERGLYDCNPTQEYSFTEALTDTIYIPYMPIIPEGKTSLHLPVATTLGPNTRGIYLPLLYMAAGSGDAFEFVEAYGESNALGVGPPILEDTIVLWNGLGPIVSTPGNEIMYRLLYDRVNPGTGPVYTALTDRHDALKYAVFDAVAIDLFRPVVVEVDVSFPIGDCNCDRQLDVSDITTFVGWMFGHWPKSCEPYLQPYGIYIADVDCSRHVDIADLVFMVDYLFGGGSAPCDRLGV